MKLIAMVFAFAVGLPFGLYGQNGSTVLVQQSNLSGYAGQEQPPQYFTITETADTLQFNYSNSYGYVAVYFEPADSTSHSSSLTYEPAQGALYIPNVPVGYYKVVVVGGSTGYSGFSYQLLNTGLSTPFFTGQASLSNGVYYLSFAGSNYFGYYSYLTDPRYIYHFDMGYEYAINANDGRRGVFLYDFKSGHFFYTSPTFPFPYLYDFSLNSTVYYYPDPSNSGHYNTNGTRYFYVFSTRQIISM